MKRTPQSRQLLVDLHHVSWFIESVNPPHVQPNERVVLFDGVCNLCTAWTRFLIKYDAQARVRMCSIQSTPGQDLLLWAGVPVDNVNTMVYVRNNQALIRSDAFLFVMWDLGFPWSILTIARVIPRFIRDFFYKRIAHNRYLLFGKNEQCFLATPEQKRRFLE
ncbi:MAG: thiol-disulfide oxidoreductase DCC family protein [Spirochaetia bacterium]|nr:thiol-disulfide oxidoreductase DCC family protein [Spirochaetia bacterium]